MVDYDILSKNLRRIKAERKLSNSAIADLTGLHLNTVWSVIAGKQYPNSKTIQDLADGLGVSVGYLFEEEKK